MASFEVLLDAPANDRSVECSVRDHLAREAEPHSTVHFVENALINSLFGLLLNEPLLESALRCFPAPHLLLWFEWMVRDIVESRAGFPDLV